MSIAKKLFFFAKKVLTKLKTRAIIDKYCEFWLVGQAVKTPASHAGNAGSIPARVTKKSIRFVKCKAEYI